MARLKAEKRQREQQRKQKITENRKHLANIRVVQQNLVFVVGLPMRLADSEVSNPIRSLCNKNRSKKRIKIHEQQKSLPEDHIYILKVEYLVKDTFYLIEAHTHKHTVEVMLHS